MITYIHIPILVLAFFILLSMWRFWACIHHMGFLRKIGRHAPFMLQRDILAAAFACVPFAMATTAWLGGSLPTQAEPISPLLAAILSIAGMCACILILGRSGERFAGHWAGSWENASSTVAALHLAGQDEKESISADTGGTNE